MDFDKPCSSELPDGSRKTMVTQRKPRQHELFCCPEPLWWINIVFLARQIPAAKLRSRPAIRGKCNCCRLCRLSLYRFCTVHHSVEAFRSFQPDGESITYMLSPLLSISIPTSSTNSARDRHLPLRDRLHCLRPLA